MKKAKVVKRCTRKHIHLVLERSVCGIAEGDIVRYERNRGVVYRVCHRVSAERWASGMNCHRPGLYLFYGAWYEPFDLKSINTFGKIEYIAPEFNYEIVGNIFRDGCEPFYQYLT